jgi:hypothetical protein
MKGGFDFEHNEMKMKRYPFYSELWGLALALAHARSGDAAMLSGYIGNCKELTEAMVRFAFEYDKQISIIL